MDSLHHYVSAERKENDEDTLLQFLISERFDTEAFEWDILKKDQSNIASKIQSDFTDLLQFYHLQQGISVSKHSILHHWTLYKTILTHNLTC